MRGVPEMPRDSADFPEGMKAWERSSIVTHKSASTLIVPMLRVGMHPVTLCVTNGTDYGFN